MISAKIIADSTYKGKRVTTFELEYPRLIHSELMTHRVFSRNAASSRAIPIEKMIAQAVDNTVMPIWTYNESGMQGKVITNGEAINTANTIWLDALNNIVQSVHLLDAAGVHKQNANRLLEPFQHIKTVVTATEFDNFFKLRYHGDAQGEIKMLAQAMLAEYFTSTPRELILGDWHLPYAPMTEGTTVDNMKISASCCAQVSYRRSDDTLEKALVVYDRLVGGEPLHASPFEHQCRPKEPTETQKGNLIGFRQLRQDIEEGKM